MMEWIGTYWDTSDDMRNSWTLNRTTNSLLSCGDWWTEISEWSAHGRRYSIMICIENSGRSLQDRGQTKGILTTRKSEAFCPTQIGSWKRCLISPWPTIPYHDSWKSGEVCVWQRVSMPGMMYLMMQVMM